MKHQKFSQELLLMTILTVISIFTWISLDVYRAFIHPQVPKVSAAQLAPLNPKLDTKVLNDLSSKVNFNKEDLSLPLSIPSSGSAVNPKITP